MRQLRSCALTYHVCGKPLGLLVELSSHGQREFSKSRMYVDDNVRGSCVTMFVDHCELTMDLDDDDA